jgi:FAD/FMN-containing dehydrogenase
VTAAGLSWGRHPRAEQRILAPGRSDQPVDAGGQRWLPYGNGRSYGDSCLNDGGALVHTRWLDNLLDFDASTGVLRCEAGVQLDHILSVLLPRGWFLPVTPGTRFVTVGGAIANDVHGKNHHRAGSFGEHLRGFELLRGDGTRLWCSRDGNADWFAATIGGLGLTGLVTRVELALRPVAGPWLDTENTRFGSLREFFDLSADANARREYTVAWIDCTARGAALGRGIFSSADHAAPDPAPPVPAVRRRALPVTPPISLVNKASVRAFNALNWRLPRKRRALGHYVPFFYPLDAIDGWNRMYGPRGFLQYQCVVPPAVAEPAIADILARIQAAGAGSFLAVLKQFGDRPAPGLLSFPRAGTTLALDFPIDAGGRVFALLDGLDGVVADAGGAVYPAKDARMPGARFRQFFPAWERFQAFLDPHVSSSFWRRVMEH